MSTPTINAAATQGLARVVTDLPSDPVAPTFGGRIYLNDIETLCARLTVEVPDLDLSVVVDRVESLADAIRLGASTDVRSQYLADDIWTLSPEELTSRVKNAARDKAVERALTFTVGEDFETELVKAAGAALTQHADSVVTHLRKSFDKQVKVIEAAHAAGITKHTNALELIDTADTKTIQAYRAVSPAVAELNRIASLRADLATVLHYGPLTPPVAAFVTGVGVGAQMQGAWNRWAGETEVVQYNQSFTGSALTRINRPRLGGPWLDLVNGGYTLRLNTAAETEAVIAASKGR